MDSADASIELLEFAAGPTVINYSGLFRFLCGVCMCVRIFVFCLWFPVYEYGIQQGTGLQLPRTNYLRPV